jgi:ERCC4-type nuclease|tara:strand:- start:3143 stop:3862 length:720 start_codon:yes stop_codon:yes gene_type:complete
LYTVEKEELLYDGKSLGSADDIYVDGRQDIAGYIKKSNKKGFTVAKLKEGDYVFVTSGGHTVGIEEKKAHDLCNSLRSRRLQRQLRRLEGAVSIPILGLRFTDKGRSKAQFSPDWWQLNNLNLIVELLKWDLRGNTILIPATEQQVLSTLKRIKNVMQPGHHLLSIIAGDDYKRVQDSSPFRKLVRRLIDGVGPTASVKLEEYYSGNVRALLEDDEEGWKDAGLHKGQRKTLGELLNAN